MTDLDGTAVHEVEGRVRIPREVELRPEAHARLRPAASSSTRCGSRARCSPRSARSGIASPARRSAAGVAQRQPDRLRGARRRRHAGFEQLQSVTLTPGELDELLVGIEAHGGQRRPTSCWCSSIRATGDRGEVLCTPVRSRLAAMRSTSTAARQKCSPDPCGCCAIACSSTDVCLVFLLNDVPRGPAHGLPAHRAHALRHARRRRQALRRRAHRAPSRHRPAHSLGAGDAPRPTTSCRRSGWR